MTSVASNAMGSCEVCSQPIPADRPAGAKTCSQGCARARRRRQNRLRLHRGLSVEDLDRLEHEYLQREKAAEEKVAHDRMCEQRDLVWTVLQREPELHERLKTAVVDGSVIAVRAERPALAGRGDCWWVEIERCDLVPHGYASRCFSCRTRCRMTSGTLNPGEPGARAVALMNAASASVRKSLDDSTSY